GRLSAATPGGDDSLLVLLLRVSRLGDLPDLRAQRERVHAGGDGDGAELPGERGRRPGQPGGGGDRRRSQRDEVRLEGVAELARLVRQDAEAAADDVRAVGEPVLRVRRRQEVA